MFEIDELNKIDQAIADGLNELGYGVDVPNDKGEMKFGTECHEVKTIRFKIVESLNNKPKEKKWPIIY